MSQGRKLTDRPKVRFCQTSESENNPNLKPCIPSNKPRIRSVVVLKQPVKIVSQKGSSCPPVVDAGNPTENLNNKVTSRTSPRNYSSEPGPAAEHTSIEKNYNASLRLSPAAVPNTVVPGSRKQNSPCANNAQHTDTISNCNSNGEACVPAADSKNVEVIYLRHAGNTSEIAGGNSTPKSQTAEAVKNGTGPKSSAALNPCHPGVMPKITVKSKQKPTAIRNVPCTSGTVPKGSAGSQKGPCTSRAAPGKTLETICETTAAAKTTAAGKTVPRTSKSAPAKPKGTEKIIPCWNQNVPSGKTVPCKTKALKPRPKTANPVKKTVLRDVVGGPVKAFVGPGVPRYDPDKFNAPVGKELPHIRPDIVSGDKLGRPEYNSIMCTINRLREVEQEKFVTDVDHLPMVYRNLVNGKVSAALDFPPDEAIYKNLVDLSINESQLPSRLTRSKDPEPRQRDVVPKLSDFFTPQYSEEYCDAGLIRPLSPENVNNWSAFAVSDKIFGWKDDMDHCH